VLTGTLSRLRTRRPKNRGLFPLRGKRFSLLQTAQTNSAVQTACCVMCSSESFLGPKAASHKMYPLSPSFAGIWNEWICVFTPPYIFMPYTEEKY
jgi:hypothetical protein